MKHTPEEYLAWIDSNVEAARKLLSPLGGTDDVTTYVLVSSIASLLANRDVLLRQPKKATAPYVLTQRDWGYNQCLEELQTDIYNRIREVM